MFPSRTGFMKNLAVPSQFLRHKVLGDLGAVQMGRCFFMAGKMGAI